MDVQKLKHKTTFTLAAFAGIITTIAIGHRWYVRWGATDEELEQPMPGDELMAFPSSNHAVTIHAPVEAVWPWLIQIGQDRGGFYSYSFLENLVRAGIHNTDRIAPEWQHLKTGDTIRLGSEKVYGDRTLLPVVELEANRYFVLKGWGTFMLTPVDEHTTRFLIRSHGRKEGMLAGLLRFLLFDPIHFVMERKMLLGIKERAERSYQQANSSRT